jgi:hypothetical protein
MYGFVRALKVISLSEEESPQWAKHVLVIVGLVVLTFCFMWLGVRLGTVMFYAGMFFGLMIYDLRDVVKYLYYERVHHGTREA